MAKYSINEVKEQLSDLREVLALARAYGTPDNPSRIGLTSLLQEEEFLLGELKALEMEASGSAAEVSIAATVGHR